MKRISLAIAVIGLMAVAAPAAAKPKTLHYEGRLRRASRWRST